MSNLEGIVIDAFFDGFTGAGLFGRLRRPGAPTEYVDSRSLAELKASGEFAAIARRHVTKDVELPPNAGDAAQRTAGGTKDDRILGDPALGRR